MNDVVVTVTEFDVHRASSLLNALIVLGATEKRRTFHSASEEEEAKNGGLTFRRVPGREDGLLFGL